MSEIITGPKLTFGKLPSYLIDDLTFSADEMAVSLYLENKPEGWVVCVKDVCKRFGWGKDKWDVICPKLKERGILVLMPTNEGRRLLFNLSWDPQKVQLIKKQPCKPTAATKVGKSHSGKIPPIIQTYNKQKPNCKKQSNKLTKVSAHEMFCMGLTELPDPLEAHAANVLLKACGFLDQVQPSVGLLLDDKNFISKAAITNLGGT